MTARKRLTAILMALLMVVGMLPAGEVRTVLADTTEKVFDATKISAAGVADKDPIAEGTTFADGYFKIVGSVTQRLNGDGTAVKSVEIGKNLTGFIQFTTTGSANVTLEVSSTGGGNTSEVALLAADGTAVSNKEGLKQVSTTDKTVLTYTGLAAGTYRVASPENAELNRGARVYTITVNEGEAAGAASLTEYLLDTTKLDGTGVADKDPVAEGTTYENGYFKVVGSVLKRTNSDGSIKCLELGKAVSGAISFTVNGTADVTIAMSSTGGSNTSAVGLIDESGALIENKEGITTVSGTSATQLTYTGLAAGTYRVVSPENAELGRGARLINLQVVQTSSGERPARAAWESVAPPKLTTATAEKGVITVAYEMVIGYDGADKVIVTMYDKNGTELANESAAADGVGGSVTFTPDASGEYTFKITAQREGEADKQAALANAVSFVLPLTTPNISSATSVGNGGVAVVWDVVAEAESYVVSYREAGTTGEYKNAATVTKTTATVTGLTIDKKYEFAVQAVRGTETTERGTLTVVATKEAQRVWSFAAFGSSTNTTDNYYTGSANEGSVTVASVNGKGKLVPASTDGLAFYYTAIDPEKENFVLSATVTVDSWTFSNGQEGFGLMAADTVGTHGDGSTFWNNSYMAVVSKVEYYYNIEEQKISDNGEKITMKLGIGAQEKRGVTAANIADGTITTNINELFTSKMVPLETSQAKKGGTFNIIGNYLNATAPSGTVPEAAQLTTFRFTIERNNTGYFISYTDKNGNTTTERFYDLERNALTQIDPDHIYVGFFAARNATITVSDISLTVSDPATDAAAEQREMTLVTPDCSIVSATATGNEEYEVIFHANADGTLNLTTTSGKVIATGAEIKADTYAYFKTTLDKGTNSFVAEFTPAADFKFSEYEVLSSYDTITYYYNVFRREFEGPVIYVSPLVETDTVGEGTKEKPTNIYAAAKYAKPGQIILLAGGEYLLTSTIKVERGNDGTAEQPIYFMADPEATERPVLNFQNKCAGLVLAGDYWIFSGFDVTKSADGQKGLQLSGNHCILQDINAYYNGNTGIQLSRYLTSDYYQDWPANNLILNCTSYANADAGYEDADGFAAKLTIADGNVFDGCIAYNNADDGWDLFAKVESGPIGKVVIKNCITYGNGYLPDGTDAGNGNGFKLGGSSISGYHELINCVAYNNKAKGIDSNSCPDIQVKNCITFNNGSYNIALYTNDAANTDYAAEGVLSFRTENLTISEQIKTKGTQDTTKIYGATNYFYDAASQTSVNSEGAKAAAEWFVSLDTSIAPTRNSDGTINRNGLLELTAQAPEQTGARMSGTANNDYSAVVTAAKAVVTETPTPTQEPTKTPEATSTPEPTKAAEPTQAQPEDTAQTDSTQTTAPAESGNTVLVIVIVVLVLLVVAGVGFVLVKKNGKKPEEK